MITILIFILTLFFVLAGVSPLFVTDENQDLVRMRE